MKDILNMYHIYKKDTHNITYENSVLLGKLWIFK